MTITLVDSHTETGADPFTIDVSAELASGNVAGNLQVLTQTHRSAPDVPTITDTSGTVNGDWIGPYDCSAEVNGTSDRRSLWMWWRTVPSDAGDIVVNWTAGRSGSVSIQEFDTTLSDGVWRLDSNGAGGVLDNDRTNGSPYGPTRMGASKSLDSGTSITGNTVQAGSEGVVVSHMFHRHGAPGNGDEHTCTGFTIDHQSSNGSGGNNYSHATAYKFSSTAESPAWSWTTTTKHLCVSHAFSYDTATPSSGTLSTPTVVANGTSTTDIADGSSTITSGSFLPKASAVYYLGVRVNSTTDEDDHALDVTSSNGLNWVLIGWYPDNGDDSTVAVYRAMESTGLSNAAGAVFSYADTGESIDRLQYVIVEIDGVDDTGFRGSAAHVQQRNPLDEFAYLEGDVTSHTSSTLTTAGDGHIAFNFTAGNALTSVSPETDWTVLHTRSDTSPDVFEMRVSYDFSATPDTTYTLSHDQAINDYATFIFALKEGAAGGGAVSLPPLRRSPLRSLRIR